MKMAEIRVDGKVAIVTGAGGGLGRSHALLLASRGAKVVVNDLGGATDGTGSGKTMAESVCDEIKKAGGEAVPDYNSVLEGDKIVKTAVDAFGTVDILVNNAGILRDISFMKQADQDWSMVLDVHLNGTRNMTKAAFPVMREKGYGRIVMTTSAAGLYGNFGQTNYSAAKMGIVGFANTLRLEGAKYNIKVNTIAPIAGSRLTAQVMPENLLKALKPEFVSPLVAYLCSEQCQESGYIYSVGGGYFSRVAYFEGEGVFLGTDKEITPEDLQSKMSEINDLGKAREPAQAMDQSMKVLKLMGLG
jgi:3-hydroxyacyl-CoA dehydrogenase/3a,7a,12a-trihydroxy-5b-cholest-24-enoyl-CoA hydratase